MSGGERQSGTEPIFSMDDMQEMRDEYEERIRVLEADKKVALEQSNARQELVEDLTIELATALEEGGRLAQQVNHQQQLVLVNRQSILDDVARLEIEVQRLKHSLQQVLAPMEMPAPGPPPASFVPATTPPMPAPPPPPPAAPASAARPAPPPPAYVNAASPPPVSPTAPTLPPAGGSSPNAQPPEIPADDMVTASMPVRPATNPGFSTKKRKIRLR